MDGYDTLLWDILKEHFGHKVEIAIYGDINNPASITLEDMDTNEVILDAGINTLCVREDGFEDVDGREIDLARNVAFAETMDGYGRY